MTIVEQLREIGRKEGLQEGYQLGRQDANKELAQQLLSDGVDRTNVKRYTGLSDSELDQL
ncbi:Rpn family recombination-promoting nuclease/putative transposase [Candidatus Williamhamiltonella defendens]|uniref:Rpn family recombination-promoting nuclease/putative transposase n=1 Tax=Candidatus Williamhamiltonella defendens TaxID=138072 RepID=UPI00158416CC|nr:Rpn family recombination-promoting nuclease/putative transposase [Candidatus Hamiltonella defensa]